MDTYHPQTIMYEEKKVTTWALWLIAFMIVFFVFYAYLMREFLLIFWIISPIILFVIFTLYNFAFYQVKVFDDKSLQFGFPNWHLRLQGHEVKSIEEIEYHPIKDFGGLGWRIGRKDGKWKFGYVVWLQKGIEVETTGGKHYVFGTNNPQSIISALQ